MKNLPEGYEFYPPELAQKHGAQEYMKCRNGDGWKDSDFIPGQKMHEMYCREGNYCVLVGTTALLTTPAPVPVCRMSSYCEGGEHDNDCPAHPSNRYIKVPPGWLAGLKEKPEGLMWYHSDKWWDFGRCNVWPEFTKSQDAGRYAYAIPAKVYEEIEGRKKLTWQSACGGDGTEGTPCPWCGKLTPCSCARTPSPASSTSPGPSAEELREKYHELIYAVGNKYPNESRHETALRYIREAEQSDAMRKEKPSS